MRFFSAIVALLLVASLTNAAVVQRRTYRNTDEILVPVAIIQDGTEIKEATAANLGDTAAEIKFLETENIANDIAKAVDEEQKLQAAEAVVEAQRRFDEVLVEEEIKEAVQEEQDKEIIKAIEEEEKEQQLKITIPENPQTIAAVLQPEEVNVIPAAAAAVEPAKVEDEKLLQLKSVVVEKDSPNQVVIEIETNNAEEPAEGTLRQATQATPTQTTTQQNFVQQFIQNSPLGQFFNQITGQTTQTQLANDEVAPATPAPTIPGIFNPATAIQNAAQSVVNSTTQAFQGLQQFASNLGNQFQSTLSSFGGQPQGANEATTIRPAGPIQQFVSTIMGNPQQAQPAPTQQGPLQGLLNIFQGNNRPQGSVATAATANPSPQPAKEPEIVEETNEAVEEAAIISADDLSTNEVRSSAEVNDSFEDTVQPEELIVVNDDASQTSENGEEQQRSNVPK